ncbi:MAG TPA: hypothetical protein P5022_14365, partial [Candidatus Paceibacterota bacterium]|nr:hypothetical protein [Candidatus Paceibacterota bacterium]
MKMIKRPAQLLGTLVVLGCWGPIGASAADIVWTNTAGGRWSDAANWAPNQVPSIDDTALITQSGVYTVAVNASNAVGGLVVGGSGGTQTVDVSSMLRIEGAGNIAAAGRLILSGTLGGSALLQLSGGMTWSGGKIDTNAAVVVNPGGQLTVSSTFNYTKSLHGALTNAGAIRFLGNGNLLIGGILHNHGGGLFDIQTDSDIGLSGGPGRIVNEGVFRKSAGAGTTACAVPIENHGAVDVQVGILTLASGSILQDGSAFTGAGKTYLHSGIVTWNGGVTSENLVLEGAALDGAGILGGTAFWGAGSIATNGALTVATNGLLTIESKYVHHKYVHGALTNTGIIRFLGNGNLGIVGILHNQAGGLIDIQTDYGFGASGSMARIVNEGVLRKSAGSGTTACAVPIENHGTVDVQVGILTLAGESVLQDGSAFTGAGKTYLDSGIVALNGGVASENLVLDGAALSGAGILSGMAFWGSGSIATNGALTIATNGLLTIQSKYVHHKFVRGALTNAGTIRFLGSGNLEIDGILHNQAGGLIDIQTDYDIGASGSTARIVNDGVFRKSAGADRTVCAAPFSNHGVVDVQTGSLILSDGSLLSGGCAFTGLGTTRLESGTNRVDGVIHSENLVLDGATLVGTGNVTGSFAWSSGTIDAGLSFYVTPHALLTISSRYVISKYLNGYVTNAGTVNFLGNGSLILAGTFHNLAGALLDIQTDYDLVAQDPAATVVNEGIVRKTATAGMTAFRVPFYNAGVVEVGTGTLNFASNYHHSAAATISLAGGAMQT